MSIRGAERSACMTTGNLAFFAEFRVYPEGKRREIPEQLITR